MTSPQQIDELLRSKGLDPADVRQKINQHIQSTFGGPQEYARAIMSKPQGQLSDPQTAAAFRAIAPGLFEGGSKPLGFDPGRPGVMSFDFGQTAPVQGIHPSAQAALDAIGQYQQANPFIIPVAPGTKARWQLQDEEAMRAQQTAEALGQEKWAWQQEQAELDRQMQERQFQADQAYRSAQLALANLKAAAGQQTGYGTPWGNIDMLVAMGADINDVMEYVNSPANYADYKSYGVTKEQMQEYARNKHTDAWKNVMDVSGAPRGASSADTARGFRQAEKAGTQLKQASAWGAGPVRFTQADYEKFAADTGKSVDEIKWLDSQGWLDGFMKSFYGQEYKGASGNAYTEALTELMERFGLPYVP